MPTRQTHTRIAVACVAFLVLAGCGPASPEKKKERPVIEDPPTETDDISPELSDSPSSDDENVTPRDHTANRDRPQTPFRLVSNPESKEEAKEEAKKEAKDEKERAVSELCVRLVGCEIRDDSPKRKDSSLNDPPKLYVIAKHGAATLMTSSEKPGWKVEFADNRAHEFIATRSEGMRYDFEVFDSQYGADKHVRTIGPFFGKDIVEELLKPPRNSERTQSSWLSQQEKIRLTLEYVGVVQWFRLANVTVPTGSPCRKQSGDEKPELEVRLFRDGKPLENVSRKTTSTCLPAGWEGTFPKSPLNCWPILEQSDVRYDVEVWDVKGANKLLCKVSDLPGETFWEAVLEKAGSFAGEEILGRVQFKSLDGPITEE